MVQNLKIYPYLIEYSLFKGEDIKGRSSFTRHNLLQETMSTNWNAGCSV